MIVFLWQSFDGGAERLPAVTGFPVDKVRVEFIGEESVGKFLEELL